MIITELTILTKYRNQAFVRKAEKEVNHRSRMLIVQNIKVIPVINKNALGTLLKSIRSITRAGMEPKSPKRGALNKAIITSLL